MNQEEQLATIQKQLDAGEIDFTKLDPERKKVLSKAIEAGVLKSPDSLEFKEIQQRTARERLGQEAKEADTISGVNLPLVGQFGNERADYELVGDLIGSFTPYIMNRKAIAKDLELGVRGRKFTQPTGKDIFKAEKFNISGSRFAKGLARVIGRRFGAVGRLLPRMVATTEKTVKGSTQFVRQMSPKTVGGGGGITDTSQSLLRTGATTELQSIGLGATGAATGSIAYDLANFSANIGSDAALDLNDIDDNTYNDLPQPARSLVDASAAFGNSVLFGVAGTTAGYVAAKGGRNLMKRLLGVNNPETVKFAQAARDRGTALSVAQLAEEAGVGTLVKNFFKILGVTPFVGGKGRAIAQQQFTALVRDKIKNAEGFAPIVHSEFLGYGAYNAMRKNYDDYNLLIADEYDQLTKLVQEGDFNIIDLKKTKSAVQEIMDGFGDSNVKQALSDKSLKKMRETMEGVPDDFVNALRAIAGQTDNFKFDSTTFTGYRQAKLLLNSARRSKEAQFNPDMHQKIIKMQHALDLDLAALEKISPNDDIWRRSHVINQLQTFNKTPDQAIDMVLGKINPKTGRRDLGDGYRQKLASANKTYYDLTVQYETNLANKIRKSAGDNQWFLRSSQVARGQFDITSGAMFESIQKNVLKTNDVEVVRQFKQLIGAANPDNEAMRRYADGYVKKLASRKIYDAFLDSLSDAGKQNVFTKSFMDARDKLKSMGLNQFKYLDEAIANDTAPVITKRLQEDIDNIGKEFIEVRKKGVLTKVKNPSYIENPVVRKQVEETMKLGSKDIDFSKIDYLGGQFNFTKFADELGLGTPGKEDALRELMGNSAFKNLKESVDIMKAASSVSYTDPSTFLLRSTILGGTAALAGGGLLLGGGMGLGMGIMVSLAMRQAGKIFADPQASTKLLNVFTEAERKAMMDPDKLGSFFAKQTTIDAQKYGPQSTILGGIIDPTEPLGKYFGPKRSRNISILFNYLNDEIEDTEEIDPNKITLQDINGYISRLNQVDTPQVNVFQLPDRVLETVAPDALVFKYATEEERNQMLDEMKGFNQADQQVESDSAEIERSVTPAAPMVNVQDPTKVPDAPQVAEAPATALGNLGNNYSFLFPQDPTGQAIAKKDTQSG